MVLKKFIFPSLSQSKNSFQAVVSSSVMISGGQTHTHTHYRVLKHKMWSLPLKDLTMLLYDIKLLNVNELDYN